MIRLLLLYYQVIADAVVLISLGYAERRVKAETHKMQEVEAEHADQDHEMDKAAKKGQKVAAARQSKRNKKLQHNAKTQQLVNRNGHAKQSHFNIQQPSKRD